MTIVLIRSILASLKCDFDDSETRNLATVTNYANENFSVKSCLSYLLISSRIWIFDLSLTNANSKYNQILYSLGVFPVFIHAKCVSWIIETT